MRVAQAPPSVDSATLTMREPRANYASAVTPIPELARRLAATCGMTHDEALEIIIDCLHQRQGREGTK